MCCVPLLVTFGKACLEWQKSYSPETICYGCTDGQTHHYRVSATLWRGPNKLSHIIYKLMLKIHKTRPLKIKWISYMKSISDDCGLSFIWNDQIPINRLLSKSIVRQKLNDQFIQKPQCGGHPIVMSLSVRASVANRFWAVTFLSFKTGFAYLVYR
jgi:hypothetical protein